LHPAGHCGADRGAESGSAAFAVAKTSCGAPRLLDEESRRLRGELDRFAEFIAKANEPTLLPSWDFEVLNEIAQKTYRDPRGTTKKSIPNCSAFFWTRRFTAWRRNPLNLHC
jgi:hypothetical protein